MRRRRWALHAVVLGVMLAALSCRSNTAGNRIEVDTLSGRRFTETGDALLDRRLQVTDVRYRDRGGFLEAQASLKNLTKRTIQCEYTFQWYDAAGWELDTANQPWLQLVVHGQQQKEVRGVAPRPGATRFRLAVRQDSAYRP
jgi:uncharacterized protein YcfL